jgi:hypothetical protein
MVTFLWHTVAAFKKGGSTTAGNASQVRRDVPPRRRAAFTVSATDPRALPISYCTFVC